MKVIIWVCKVVCLVQAAFWNLRHHLYSYTCVLCNSILYDNSTHFYSMSLSSQGHYALCTSCKIYLPDIFGCSWFYWNRITRKSVGTPVSNLLQAISSIPFSHSENSLFFCELHHEVCWRFKSVSTVISKCIASSYYWKSVGKILWQCIPDHLKRLQLRLHW